MQIIDGQLVYSATDLVGFLACEHLTNLERAAAEGKVQRPMRRDPELDRLSRLGPRDLGGRWLHLDTKAKGDEYERV